MSGTLYVSDLDGTLLSPDSEVTARSAEMINEALRRGAHFTVATARTPATVSRLLKDVEMKLPAIVMTGAALWNPSSGKFSQPRFLDEEVAKELVEVYRRHNMPTFVYTLREGKIEIFHIGAMTPQEQKFVDERRDSPYKDFFIPTDGESTLPERLDNVLLFYAMQPSEPLRRVYEEAREIKGCNPYYYHDIFGPETAILEVFSSETSKAAAIRRICEERGFGRVVAFGDNINDLPMLREADRAVAVANAVEEVKTEADEVIGSNATDSVASYILKAAKLASNPD